MNPARAEYWSRSQCNCLNEDGESHACPFAEEIHDNHDPEYCKCCERCTQECREDI